MAGFRQQSSAGVVSFNGRTGAVTPQASDYAAAYVARPLFTDLQTVYVTAAGNDSNDGLTPRSALASLSAAATNLGSTGGAVILGPGTFPLSGAVQFNGPTDIGGVGAGLTIITDAGTSNDGLIINASFSHVHDLSIERSTASGSQTGGAGLKNLSGEGSTFERLFITNWWFNYQNVAGYFYRFINNYCTIPVTYNLYQTNPATPDQGDNTVYGNTLSGGVPGGSAMRLESGGGLRFVNNKILNHNYGIDVQMTDGSSTSVMVIADNSIEVCAVSAIRLGRIAGGTTGTYSRIVINGNQINQGTAVSAQTVLSIGAGISYCTINNNMINGVQAYTTAIALLTGATTGFIISENNFAAHLVGINCEVATDAVIGPQNYQAVTTYFESTETDFTGTSSPMRWHEYRCDIGHLTSSSVYVDLWEFTIPSGEGGRIDVEVAGFVNGIGAFALTFSRIFEFFTGNVAMTTVGADTTAGAAVDFEVDVTTTAGSFYIALRLNAAGGGTSVKGQAQIKAQGRFAAIAQLVT